MATKPPPSPFGSNFIFNNRKVLAGHRRTENENKMEREGGNMLPGGSGGAGGGMDSIQIPSTYLHPLGSVPHFLTLGREAGCKGATQLRGDHCCWLASTTALPPWRQPGPHSQQSPPSDKKSACPNCHQGPAGTSLLRLSVLGSPLTGDHCCWKTGRSVCTQPGCISAGATRALTTMGLCG